MTAAPSGTVLVVDDHEMVRSTLVMALQTRGLRAIGIGPAELVDRIREPAPAGGLVLLDLDAASGGDRAAARRVRGDGPDADPRDPREAGGRLTAGGGRHRPTSRLVTAALARRVA
jgi:CheY-like chemotaxis protein